MVNIIGTDVAATLGARASATIVYTMLNRIDSVPAQVKNVLYWQITYCYNIGEIWRNIKAGEQLYQRYS